MSNVYILGAGAQARETCQIYVDNGMARKVKGFMITVLSTRRTIAGKNVFVLNKFKNFTKTNLFICAVGNPFKRKGWVEELAKKNFRYDTVIHKTVVRGRNVEIGEGGIICAGCILTCDIKLGKHVLMNIDSTVSHDVEICDFATLSPGVKIGGRVQIGEGTFIGIGASVINDVKIGKNCFIGAGALVTEDIPDNTLAYGLPAKPIRKIRKHDWDKFH